MIQITPQMRILVATEAIDGRKRIDSLAQLCREKLRSDPFSGSLFIFRSRSGKAIRILAYDGQGFWLATKRLSKGHFRWWPAGAEAGKTLLVHQAQLLLAAGNPDMELEHLDVGFVSLTEALDLTTPADRAMAGLLAVFAEFEREILRERVRAGLAHARENGKRLGRPLTAALQADQIRKLRRSGLSKSQIARQLTIARASVRRTLASPPKKKWSQPQLRRRIESSRSYPGAGFWHNEQRARMPPCAATVISIRSAWLWLSRQRCAS